MQIIDVGRKERAGVLAPAGKDRACRIPARRKGKHMIYIEEEKMGDRFQRFQAYARGLEEGTEDTEVEAEET